MRDEPLFMPWVLRLPELGDPIRQEHARLHDLACRAAGMERHALALRAVLASRRAALLERIMANWTLGDMQRAADAACRCDTVPEPTCCVEDFALRLKLQSLDGWQLASEALQLFDVADVLGQHNLLSTATDDERRQAIARVIDWWNVAARPVVERLSVS